MDDVFIQNAQNYAARNQLSLRSRLGSGIHGIIFSAQDKRSGGRIAVKVHREVEPYLRERDIYQRLERLAVRKVHGFNIPTLAGNDDHLLIIEMSIVTRPFVLDFAGAYLDAPPDFPESIWEEWEAQKRELFENQWPQVKKVLAALEDYGIFMVDVSPSNIAFLD